MTITKTQVALFDGDKQCLLGEGASLKVDIYFEWSFVSSEIEIEGVLLLVSSEEGLQLL